MDYIIAIPSLKRSNILLNKTYKFLKKHNIDDSKIYIFVIDNEYETYKSIFPQCNIVVGRFGAKNNKNYILDYFDQHKYILQLDDDIKDVYRAIDDKTLEPLQSLENFVNHGISMIESEECNVMGVYPIKNAKFMFNNVNKLSSTLSYCCGALLLLKNHRLVQREYNLIEDFEFSLKNFLEFGKILRNNRVVVEANQYTLQGGLQYNNSRNKQNKLIEINKLKSQYPEYVKCVMKHNKQPDIKFLNKTVVKEFHTLENIEEEEEEVESNILNTYYYGDSTIPKYYKLCLESWLKLGYKVNLHTNENIDDLPENVEIIPTVIYDQLQPAQQADMIRFEFLKDNPNQIWIDLDMYLLRRIPNSHNIISSEQPNRTGAYATERQNTPNIGVLKLKNTSIFNETIKKCQAIKNTSKVSCFMKVFIKLLPKYDLEKYVSHWSVYCPLDWSNMKEAFSGKPLKSKYGKKVLEIEDIKNDNKIIGVHLWSSFIRKLEIKGHASNSFIAFLIK
tara:strand:- start:1220 stop:2734 length:1515 start_codon:yes stop_codon:yes gene_type:complete